MAEEGVQTDVVIRDLELAIGDVDTLQAAIAEELECASKEREKGNGFPRSTAEEGVQTDVERRDPNSIDFVYDVGMILLDAEDGESIEVDDVVEECAIRIEEAVRQWSELFGIERSHAGIEMRDGAMVFVDLGDFSEEGEESERDEESDFG